MSYSLLPSVRIDLEDITIRCLFEQGRLDEVPLDVLSRKRNFTIGYVHSNGKKYPVIVNPRIAPPSYDFEKLY